MTTPNPTTPPATTLYRIKEPVWIDEQWMSHWEPNYLVSHDTIDWRLFHDGHFVRSFDSREEAKRHAVGHNRARLLSGLEKVEVKDE